MEDQEQGTEVVESQVTEGETPETEDQDQSNKASGDAVKEKLYKLPDGREVTADDFQKEYRENLLPDYTRKSQKLAAAERRLAELEKAATARESKASEDARSAVDREDALKDVHPSVREAIISIVTPVLEQRFKAVDEERAQKEADAAFDRELDNLESEFKGGDGLPKFDREAVISAMREHGNRIFDPRAKFLQMHEAEVVDRKVKEALKKQSGGVVTENTGEGGPKKPDTKTPSTFMEASRAALTRF